MQFKCKSTNLVYSFEFEVDIQSMLKHPDYEAVTEETVEEIKPAAKSTKKQAKVTPDESNIDGA